MNPLSKNIIARLTSECSYVILLLLMVITSLPSELPEGTNMSPVLLIKLVPLLIVFPGLLLNKLRAHIWLCFIVLFYFTQAVVEAFLSVGAYIDLAITVLTTVLFLASMFYVKWERALGRSL